MVPKKSKTVGVVLYGRLSNSHQKNKTILGKNKLNTKNPVSISEVMY
jgi:hypothetical protein